MADVPPTRRRVLAAGALGAGLALAGGLRRAAAEDEAPAPAAGKSLKILVLGGTGFLGPATVDAALANGHEVTLFNRGKTNPHLYPDLEKLRGDRDGNLKALEGRSWDAVIDTSGYVPRIVRQSAELLKDKVGQYLFVSTISVYPGFGTSDTTITEDTPVATMDDPTNEEVSKHYGPLKALCEDVVTELFPSGATNIRPGLIVGPRDPTDRFTYWPWRIAKGGDVLAPGDGTTGVQVIDARDLGAFMVRTLEERTTGTYNAVGHRGRVAFSEFLGALKCELNTETTLHWVDEEFLLARKVRPFLHLPLWIPKGKLPHVDNARGIAKGMAFRPLTETARDTEAWTRTWKPGRRMRMGLPAKREATLLEAFESPPDDATGDAAPDGG